jgi:predicted  nucleic acid-binding Zn-ribbon protein
VSTDTLNLILNIVTILGTGGALGVVFAHIRGLKTIKQVTETDIRDHYAQEVARYADEARDLRAELSTSRQENAALQERFNEHRATSEERHSECVQERNEAKRQLRCVEDKLIGVARQFAQYQRTTAGTIPPEMLTSLKEIEQIATGPRRGGK